MAYPTILPNEYLKLSQQQHLKSRTTLLTVSHRTCTRYVGPRHKVLISWNSTGVSFKRKVMLDMWETQLECRQLMPNLTEIR